MHQALYRKWRPKTFADVCGQEHITSVLRYEVEQGAPSHAYLFCGSRGTGKTTCAKILAKAINCTSPENGSPCCRCEACLAIENGSATDVLEMDAASNNSVEDIRDIRDEVVYTPSLLKYRVYIVDEVHMLSTSAFNALLKTLEEPPAHVVFILATTELQKLPATIVSRCQRFDFRRISVPVLTARISHIAEKEGLSLLPDAAERIARLSQGGMRDAISLLELCGSTREQITVATVNEMIGSAGRENMLRVVEAVLASNYDTIFSLIDEAVCASRDLLVFWQDLIALYRDLLVIKTTEAATRYLDLTDAEAAKLGAIAAGLKKATLLSHCKLLEDALFAMQQSNAVKRIIAELTLVRLCDASLDTSAEGLLSRIERLEDALSNGAPLPQKVQETNTVMPLSEKAPVKEPPQEAPAPKAAPKAAPTAGSAPAKEIPSAPAGSTRVLHRLRGFVNCVERVRRENSMLAPFVESAKAFVDDSNTVVIRLADDFAKSMLELYSGGELLRRALSAELKRELGRQELVLEVADQNADKTDTVLDDILEAAGDAVTVTPDQP